MCNKGVSSRCLFIHCKIAIYLFLKKMNSHIRVLILIFIFLLSSYCYDVAVSRVRGWLHIFLPSLFFINHKLCLEMDIRHLLSIVGSVFRFTKLAYIIFIYLSVLPCPLFTTTLTLPHLRFIWCRTHWIKKYSEHAQRTFRSTHSFERGACPTSLNPAKAAM